MEIEDEGRVPSIGLDCCLYSQDPFWPSTGIKSCDPSCKRCRRPPPAPLHFCFFVVSPPQAKTLELFFELVLKRVFHLSHRWAPFF